jgi:hypothetical protein
MEETLEKLQKKYTRLVKRLKSIRSNLIQIKKAINSLEEKAIKKGEALHGLAKEQTLPVCLKAESVRITFTLSEMKQIGLQAKDKSLATFLKQSLYQNKILKP